MARQGGPLQGHQVAEHPVGVHPQALQHLSRAGEKVLGPLEHHPQGFEAGEGEGAHPPGGEDAPGGAHPDAGHPQQGLVVGPVDLHREKVQVAQGPGALGIHPGVEVGRRIVQQLLRPEVVEPQQPVRLVQPVLPQQGRLEIRPGGEEGAVRHRHVGRVEHPLELVPVVEGLGQRQDVPVALRRGADDHLGGLARRGKPGGVAVFCQLAAALPDAVPDLGHGGQDGPLFLVGTQAAEAGLAGQLDVDAQPVGQQPQPAGEEGFGPGDGLGVDVAVEAVLLPQEPEGLDHGLGGAVGPAPHGGGEEQPLDVVAPVEGDGELRQLPGGEGGPRQVVGAAVDAVGAVVGAAIGQQHLQQGDAPAVGGEGVAAAGGHGAAQPAGPGGAIQPAGGAGRVVLGRVGQDGQLVQQLHAAPPSRFSPL